MFVQRLYGLNDEQTEYQIKSRRSFHEFIGICTVDDVPDARTIWKYREELTRCGAYNELFKQFYAHLQSLGLIVNKGKIIDVSFVVSPRQRNTRQENQAIKKGEGDSLWNNNPHKKCHKDIDTRWTKKGGDKFYGYKNYAKVCRKTKLITGYDTTSVSVHDPKRGTELVDDNDAVGEMFWIDADYVGTKGDFVNKSVTPIK